jgi:twitching motility protein PilT
VVSAFTAEIQPSVAAQLADSIVGVIAQRLRFRQDLNIRVPELEILVATHAVKNFIRNRDFFKIASAIETGAEHGMWSFQRYRAWLEARNNWSIPGQSAEGPDTEVPETAVTPAALNSAPRPEAFPTKPAFAVQPEQNAPKPSTAPAAGGRIEIEPVESEFGKILKRPGEP